MNLNDMLCLNLWVLKVMCLPVPVGAESDALSCLSPSSSSELEATTPRFTVALLVGLACLSFALDSGSSWTPLELQASQ